MSAVSSERDRQRTQEAQVRAEVDEWLAAGATVTRRGVLVELVKPEHHAGRLYLAVDVRSHPWAAALVPGGQA